MSKQFGLPPVPELPGVAINVQKSTSKSTKLIANSGDDPSNSRRCKEKEHAVVTHKVSCKDQSVLSPGVLEYVSYIVNEQFSRGIYEEVCKPGYEIEKTDVQLHMCESESDYFVDNDRLRLASKNSEKEDGHKTNIQRNPTQRVSGKSDILTVLKNTRKLSSEEVQDNIVSPAADGGSSCAEVDVSILFSYVFDNSYKRHVKKSQRIVSKKRKRCEKEVKESDLEEKPSKKHKKQLPNHFLAIQIGNKEVQKNLALVQEHVQERHKELTKSFVPLAKTHVTLFVLRLEDIDDVARAQAALDACSEHLKQDVLRHTLTLEVSGLNNFRNQVVFAQLGPEHARERLGTAVAYITQVFENFGFKPSKDFKPHATIMKLSKMPFKLQKKVKKIHPSTYDGFLNATFGSQTVRSVQLCSMLETGEDGYYKIIHEIPLVPNDYVEPYPTLALEKPVVPASPAQSNNQQTVFEETVVKNLTWIFQKPTS